MPKPSSPDEAAAFLLDAVRKGCLGDGDAQAVRLLLAERRQLMAERFAIGEKYDRLVEAADDCLGLMEAADLEDTEGEDGRIQTLRDALR